MTSRLKKYFYKHTGTNCDELCQIRSVYGDEKIHIGSESCQECINNMAFSTDEHWIKCKKIKDATLK